MSVARKLIQFAMLPVELQYLYMHSISLPDRQIVFAKNSKAGCTSVAHALQAALSNYPCSGRIHEENDVLIQGYDNWSIARVAFESETVFKFTTIRNPLRRIVSAYLDIFVERRNPASIHHRAAIKFVERDGRDALTKRFSRFVDFIQEDIDILGPETDRHWRPQVQNIALDHIRYNRIGRIEDAARWLPEVFEANGLRRSAAAFGQQRFNASKTAEFTISPNDIRRVEELFRRDYELYEELGV